jgi:hypothetical protein
MRVNWETPVRRKVAVGFMEKLEANLAWFPRYQAHLREHQPPTLIWGPAGETHVDVALPLVRDFLHRQRA